MESATEMSLDALETRRMIDDSLLGFIHGTHATLDNYNARATRVRRYFAPQIADALTNKSLHRGIAKDVARLVASNPKEIYIQEDLPLLRGVCLEPWEAPPTETLTMLNGSE